MKSDVSMGELTVIGSASQRIFTATCVDLPFSCLVNVRWNVPFRTMPHSLSTQIVNGTDTFASRSNGAAWNSTTHEPETIYVVPIKSDGEHYPPEGKLRVYRSKTGGNEWEPLTKGLPQSNCYVNVLRDSMAIDSLEPCGVYFGTTGGQVYASADSGDTWSPIVRDLPPVLSVEVQTLP